LIGRTLAHYEIAGLLGKGGMGEVYIAEDTKLHRRVALKVLPEEMAADPDRRARFQRKAQAVAALNHPNIVTVVIRWSPDVGQIAFLVEGEETKEVWTVDAEGVPRAVGEPEYVVRTEGTWHVHNGGWSADSKQIVYTRDMDYGDIYELVERR